MTSTGKLPVRPLGSQGLRSSAQGLGCMSMAGNYFNNDSPFDKDKSVEVISRFQELTEGATHLDTADVYGPEASEKIVGEPPSLWCLDHTSAARFRHAACRLGCPLSRSIPYLVCVRCSLSCTF